MKANLTGIIIASLAITVGCSTAQEEAKVLAEVNGVKLTYEFLMDQFPPEYRSAITKQQLADAVEAWIETELLYQEALKHNFNKDKQLKNLIEQKSKELVAAKYVDASILTQVDVSDQEIDSVYNSQKDKFSVDEDLYKLSHIVLATQSAADAVHSRLEKGDDFAALAADYSEDPQSRSKGGEIGLLPLSAFEKDMAAAIAGLKSGQFTKPLASQSGYYHIFLLTDKKPSGETLPLAEIKNDISQSIEAQKREQQYEELVSRLQNSADIKRYPVSDTTK